MKTRIDISRILIAIICSSCLTTFSACKTNKGMPHSKDGKAIINIATYNGGIGSVFRWKDNIYYNDTDEFVEQIPYDETRDYVKKVFKSYWNYTRIYQK